MKRLGIVTALIICCFTACNKYDDSELKERMSSVEQRVSNLEGKVSSMNSEISNLQFLINSHQNGLTITKYEETWTGYRLTFSNGSTIDISNGKDGVDGEDGQDGKDGQDGTTPIIGVMSVDGVYYWTITINGTTTFLLNTEGDMMPVYLPGSGSGSPGINGKDGKDGKDGITPIIRINNEGYWIVSYDNGISFTMILDTNEYPVSALGQGGSGTGSSTEDGFCFIKEVREYLTYVDITFYNGSVISFMKRQELAITFPNDPSSEITLNNDNTYNLYYKITDHDDYTNLETIDKGNVTSKVVPTNQREGYIVITATGVITNETKVIVLLYNKVITVTNVFAIKSNEDSRIDNVIPHDWQDELEEYIPIYRGTNPPNIEGAYIMEPYVAVYCSDGTYAPGKEISERELRFYGQNISNNTVNIEGYQANGYSEGSGAFISGEGNYFTAYFNTTGISNNIETKMAVIVSGEKTSNGIKNMYYAFVMVAKGSDPNGTLMDVGGYRIFKDNDGFSPLINWAHTKSFIKKIGVENLKLDDCSMMSK